MIRYSFGFLLDAEKGRQDLKLRFRVRWNGDVAAFGVGFRVNPDKWSRDTQRCKKSSTHGERLVPASTINAEIARFEETAGAVFEAFDRAGVMPTSEMFREAFRVKIGRAPSVDPGSSVMSVFDDFILRSGSINSWADATFVKFHTFRLHLDSFSAGASIDAVDDAWLHEFILYLHRVPLKNTTIAKMVGLMKWFLRWAASNGFYTGRGHETFRPKFKGTDGSSTEMVFLSWDELMKMYGFQFEPGEEHLVLVRDVFCFCCFTSLRFSDVYKLRKSDVFPDHISVVTKKTDDALVIDLNKYSRAILAKYSGVAFRDGLALPVMSNVMMNRYLKDVARACGFSTPQSQVFFMGSVRHESVRPKWKCLTMHAARRTFVVCSLYLGIPAEVVMKWTGHSDFSAMKPYITIVDQLKSREMGKWDLG